MRDLTPSEMMAVSGSGPFFQVYLISLMYGSLGLSLGYLFPQLPVEIGATALIANPTLAMGVTLAIIPVGFYVAAAADYYILGDETITSGSPTPV